ncbi:DUF4440 domain-containing protein [Denitratisoma sp. DHT3]|uniref:nuclear transport factor 2 family protein n=1 Tax=Denitratisoma sp. DHT3 TaxID=1981880 RepID=UPI001198341D|nr:nuclear transport factor 2 family protein [Denitratisoma sp. DHT3]QDX80675.1 DUF4440 domain-containing protein [Denitratisoma sp. DHT3]
MTARSPFSPISLAAGLFALTLLSLPVRADPLQDASKLLKQNQHAQALEQVDKFLAAKPKDPQGRFLRGVILTEMGRSNDAIAIFSRLTEDYPQLPEPYNNLAVIYAQQKQYDKAKQALETAIRTHPSYATAHENLGDIYARMASQAYDKALQLDSSNSTAQTKLAMIRDLMGGSIRTGVPPAVAAPPALAAAPKTPAAPAAPAPKAVEPAKAVVPPKPVVVAAATAPHPGQPAPAAPAPAPAKAVEPKANAGDPSGEVGRLVNGWAKAWSKKDVKAYLAVYAKDFAVPGGATRAAWEKERNLRIKKPGNIEVAVDDLKITANGPDQAVAKFRQHYKSATLKSSSNKVLHLVKRDGRWQIQQERIGN